MNLSFLEIIIPRRTPTTPIIIEQLTRAIAGAVIPIRIDSTMAIARTTITVTGSLTIIDISTELHYRSYQLGLYQNFYILEHNLV